MWLRIVLGVRVRVDGCNNLHFQIFRYLLLYDKLELRLRLGARVNIFVCTVPVNVCMYGVIPAHTIDVFLCTGR